VCISYVRIIITCLISFRKPRVSAPHLCYDTACSMQMMHYAYIIYVQIALTFTWRLTLEEIFCRYSNLFGTPGSSLSVPPVVIGLQWPLAGRRTLSVQEKTNVTTSSLVPVSVLQRFVLLTQYCAGDKIEKNEMAWACGVYG